MTMRAPLVPITIAFMTGLAWRMHLSAPPAVVLPLACIAGVAALAIRRPGPGRLVLLGLWALLGALRLELWFAHPAHALRLRLSEEPAVVALHGVVLDDPVEALTLDELGRQTCRLALRHVRNVSPRERLDDAGRHWHPVVGRVRATFQTPTLPVANGDEIVVEGAWSAVPAPGNPGQYDWRAALARQRVHGLLRVRPFDSLAILRHGDGSGWLAAILRGRADWAKRLDRVFTRRDAGLLRSLLLGARSDLDERLETAFIETGTIHLLVISGFNVGLVAALLELLLRVLGFPWRLRLLMSAAALGAYAVLTGLQPPVIRAVVMAWMVLAALAVDRPICWFNLLAGAALGILLVVPTQLFDASFQLSFGAVLSLLLFSPRWAKWLSSRAGWLRPGWLRRYLAVGTATTAAIWVGLAPILAWYFYLLTPVSVLANLLLAPPMSALVSLGTGALFGASLFEPLLRWAAPAMRLLLELIVRSVAWCHALPAGCWVVGRPPLALLLGYYALLALTLCRSWMGWRAGRVLCCWAAGLAVWVWALVGQGSAARRWLRVDLLDMGHGDSLVIRAPGGRTLVVDTGSASAGAHRLVPFLKAAGIRAVDALVLTHGDEDHLGGAVPLLQALEVRRLLTNGTWNDTMSARAIRRLAAAQRVPQAVISAGSAIETGPGTTIRVLHPPEGLVSGTAPASNDNSIVLRVAKGGASFLLTGDLEEAGVPVLLRAGRPIRSTVLKVPHHGSRLGAAGRALVRSAQPSVALLSVGRAHHLPARETLEMLAQEGVPVLSTRDHGALQARTDGRRLILRTFRGAVAPRCFEVQALGSDER